MNEVYEYPNSVPPPMRRLFLLEERMKSIEEDGENASTDLDARVPPPSVELMPVNQRRYILSTLRNDGNFATSYTLQSSYASVPLVDQIATYGAGGRLRVADASVVTDAVSLGQLNGRLSAAAKTAIDALPSTGATVDQLIAALKLT